MVDKVVLVKPNDANAETAAIFEDIRKAKGANYLTPTWGFFALDVDLLRHWWGLTKRLQMADGDLPKPLLNSISLVCAAEVDCPRCINNHQTHLIEHFGLTEQDVYEILNFEKSTRLDAKTKAVLSFARKVAFALGTTDEDLPATQVRHQRCWRRRDRLDGHAGVRHGAPCCWRCPVRRW